MSAKKKTAKKAAAKKTAAKKTTARKTAAKKTAAKKVAAKKTVAPKKAATRKSAARKATGKAADAAPAASGKTASSKSKQSDTPSSKKKVAASSLVRGKNTTPAIFKLPSKRLAPIVFTLDDVRELLDERSKSAKAQKAHARATRKVAAKKTDDQAAASEAVKNSKHAAASLADILGQATNGTSPGIVTSAGREVPKGFQKYYNLLIELRDHVRDELNLHSNDTLKRAQQEDAGNITTSSDAGTDNFDRDFALSLLSSEQEALKEIEAAIERIFNGTYGVCEITGQKIKPARLQAVPFTRFSLEGQQEYERTARKRAQRTGAFLNEGSAETVAFSDDDSE